MNLFIVGLTYLILTKEYYLISFYAILEIVSIVYIIVGPVSLNITILAIVLTPFLICIKGLYYVLTIPKILFDLQNGFDKYFPVFFINLSLLISLLIINLDSVFYKNDLTIILTIISFVFLVTVLTFLVTFFLADTFVDLIFSFLLSLFLSISLFNFRFDLNQLLTPIIIIIFSFLMYLHAKNQSKFNSRLILFLLVILISSFSFKPSLYHNDYTLEDIATIMKDNGVTNTSYWVFPDQSIRMSLKYFLNGNFSINYGNFGYFPFSDNSSNNLDQYSINNPQVKFFLINTNYLLDHHLLNSLSWLQFHFQEYKLFFNDLGYSSSISLYIKK